MIDEDRDYSFEPGRNKIKGILYDMRPLEKKLVVWGSWFVLAGFGSYFIYQNYVERNNRIIDEGARIIERENYIKESFLDTRPS
jgi:hypothetical protein